MAKKPPKQLGSTDQDELYQELELAFPKWTCECKRLVADTDPLDDTAAKPVKCPTCNRAFDGELWYWSWHNNDGEQVYEHECWPKWYDCRGEGKCCTLCGKPITNPYESWACSCREAYEKLSQGDVIGSPLHCEECGRVWDGRDWFKSVELYNAIVLWENLITEADALLKRGERADPQKEKWAVELMDFCDTHTNMDTVVFWKLDRALDVQLPLTDEDRMAVSDAMQACHPIMDLIWHRAASRPWDPNEWLDQEPDNDSGKSVRAQLRQHSHEIAITRLRPQQQEIVDVICEAGRRLTMAEILSALAPKGKRRSEGWAKNILSPLVQFGVLTNATDSFGAGYGRPEWTTAADTGHSENGQSRD